jgi:hypothetical protein
MLLQAMKGKLCLVIDENFEGLSGLSEERIRVAR